MSRWDHLPISEQAQRHLASTTSTSTLEPPSTVAAFRRNLGTLIRQEITDNDQAVCYYKNLSSSDSPPIPYLCELGCCSHGCCSPGEMLPQTSSYGWAIALLVIFLIVTIFSIIAIFAVWLTNRHKERIHKEQLQEKSLESSSASQISGPTTSYYNPDMYYPYTYNNKY